MTRVGNQDQAFGSPERVKDPHRMVCRSVTVERSMDKEDRSGDPSRRCHGTHCGHIESASRLSLAERFADRPFGEKERRPLASDGVQVRKGFSGDDRRHPWIVRRLLQCHGGSQGCADENDRTGWDGIEHPRQICLFEVPVRARIAARVAMGTAIVGNHVEATMDEPLHDSGTASAVVSDSMKIDEGAAPILSRLAAPAPEGDARSFEADILTPVRSR